MANEWENESHVTCFNAHKVWNGDSNPFKDALRSGQEKRNADLEVCQQRKENLLNEMLKKFTDICSDDIEAAAAAGQRSVKISIPRDRKGGPSRFGSILRTVPPNSGKRWTIASTYSTPWEWNHIYLTEFKEGSTVLKVTAGDFWSLLNRTLVHAGMELFAGFGNNNTPNGRYYVIEIKWRNHGHA